MRATETTCGHVGSLQVTRCHAGWLEVMWGPLKSRKWVEELGLGLERMLVTDDD